MVVVGVIGEGVFEGFVSREDGRIQSIDGALLSLAQQQASDISDRADKLAGLLKIEQGIVARLQEVERNTEARLVNATAEAERERSARVELQKSLILPSLDDKERNALTDELRPNAKPGITILVRSSQGGVTESLAVGIYIALREAGFTDPEPKLELTGIVWYGTSVGIPHDNPPSIGPTPPGVVIFFRTQQETPGIQGSV